MHAPRPSYRRAPAPRFAAVVSLLAVLATASAAGPVGPEIVSVTPAGSPGNNFSNIGAVSANGRIVAFQSPATDLVAGDTNGFYDVFVRDRRAGATSRVSVDPAGLQGNSNSFGPSLSANGRTVAFYSAASNLVTGDANGASDVFARDLKAGVTTRLSTAEGGTEGDGGSFTGTASISANGRFVVFSSDATNLVPGDTNGTLDVFLRDVKRGTITRLSVDSAGNQGDGFSYYGSISANGRFVAFQSAATNLVPGDTNGFVDIFLHDIKSGTTTRVSVDSAGNQADKDSQGAVVASSGKLVAFRSNATNLVPGDTNTSPDTFVHDLRTGETRRVSVDSAGQQGLIGGYDPALAPNGKFVLFASGSSNLVPGDANATDDVFLHDLKTGETRLLSLDAQGVQGNGGSSVFAGSLSSNGKYLAIASAASNFAAGDANGTFDMFLLRLK